MKINKIKRRNKILPTAIAAVVAIAILSVYLATAYSTKNLWPFIEQHPSVEKADSDDTKEIPQNEKAPVVNEDKKGSIREEEPSQTDPANPSDSKREVEVGISYASVQDNIVEIRAFTPSVIESTGTCTATLVQGSQQVVRSSQSFIDSSSSQCEAINIPASNFPSLGTWLLTVTYESPNSSGVSATREISL